MKIDEMIAKWHIALTEQSGEVALRINGKATAKQVEALKKAKPEIIAELQHREAEKAARIAKEKAEKEAERKAILAGEKAIRIVYYDGEYLQGHNVSGPAAELLKDLGLAEHVSGWGCHVDHIAAKALGEEFTYQQAAEYARPALEAKAAKVAAKEAARQAKFDEARETGKPVLLHKWTSDCCDRREECSLDIHYEHAMPDGSVKHEWHHTW
jgi:hypothetical protein